MTWMKEKSMEQKKTAAVPKTMEFPNKDVDWKATISGAGINPTS